MVTTIIVVTIIVVIHGSLLHQGSSAIIAYSHRHMMLLLWHLALDWLSFCKVVWKGVRVSLVCSVCLSQISDPLKSYPYIYIYIYDHCYLPQFCILYLQLFSFKKFSFFPMFFPHGVWRSKKSALIELAFPFNFSIFCEQLNLSTVAMLANPSSPCYQSPELQHILIFSSTLQYTYMYCFMKLEFHSNVVRLGHWTLHCIVLLSCLVHQEIL